MLEDYVADNYYARFDTRSYHRFRETYVNARQSQWSAKSRSKALVHSACLKSTNAAITATKKYTLMLDST